LRSDGKRVKNTEPMYALIPYIMPQRYDALNSVTVHLPYRPIHDYLVKKRKEGVRLSHMSLIIAAYLRCAAEYPLLNRFIMKKKIYAHNDFTVSMVVLRPGDMDGTMTKVALEMTDTIFDVNRKIMEFLEQNKAAQETNATDTLMSRLLAVPGLVSAGVGLIKFADRHGLLPKKLIDASPFHCSLLISNLASIRTNHIYHHIYEFGTAGVFITMGNSIEKPEYDANGVVQLNRYIPCGVVMDERICSGSYFARVFRRLQQYLNDPSLLELPPRVVTEDR
jgi:hypothetical protein